VGLCSCCRWLIWCVRKAQITIKEADSRHAQIVLSNCDLAYVSSFFFSVFLFPLLPLLLFRLPDANQPTRTLAVSQMPFAVLCSQRFPQLVGLLDKSLSISPFVRLETYISGFLDLAIDIVEIQTNTSVIPDEFLCHRLGMVPLDSTNIDDKLIYTRDCFCDQYCERCSVTLSLHARCTGEDNVTVYARDLVIAEGAQLGSPVINGVFCPRETVWSVGGGGTGWGDCGLILDWCD